MGRDLHGLSCTPVTFYFCLLCLAPSSLVSSGDSVPLLARWFPYLLLPLIPNSCWVWPPPLLSSFPFSLSFWRLPLEGGEGASLESHLLCYGWEPMATLEIGRGL